MPATPPPPRTKLIHGGLRYLEYYEFRLVREALFERERLLESAPHIIWPLRFILPHEKGIRPAWFVRLGLFLYDHLAPRKKLPGTETHQAHPASRRPGPEARLRHRLRLFRLLGRGQPHGGAQRHRRLREAAPTSACAPSSSPPAATARPGSRRLQNVETGETEEVRAKVIVNAGGPFVADVLNAKLGLNTNKNVRLVKGSHIVVPKLFDTKEAFILQNTDKRIVFAIPYQEKFTLIGTTDIPVEAVPDKKVDDQRRRDPVSLQRREPLLQAAR